jgi:hypothetical protein
MELRKILWIGYFTVISMIVLGLPTVQSQENQSLTEVLRETLDCSDRFLYNHYNRCLIWKMSDHGYEANS